MISFTYVIEKKGENNDISRSQTAVFYFSYKSQRSLVTRHGLSWKKVNLYVTHSQRELGTSVL